ncbi:uncharacterized protein SPPG_02598 [Spizellomyces punctatus DAOM BR117]|uniref:F-box domain-containing protein n=1 Tax=Spizellomyces punctatus (strain DAOM BR117) TaxID=645134 RepID=A0A0L0HMT2_SPIPD|nr:uncharacterized protein SPPG_02598 [Spizellomyces punctatus DAOM BR117]KND02099.1 hypothetical protein SPPG_02598 [Spizellomyces punctatus DAOM BR117]|eukprot:XP_016610138.1 hypothetical protein SPPG_02598 [Spizellomyces punctatus DAOM BR117]
MSPHENSLDLDMLEEQLRRTTIRDPGILDLPPEILLESLKYLDVQNRAKIRLISRFFEGLFWTPTMWHIFDPHGNRRVTKDDDSSVLRTFTHKLLQECSASIKTFRYSGLHSDSLAYLSTCRNLSELALRRINGDVLVSAMKQLSLGGAFIKLRRLDITMEDYRATTLSSESVGSLLAFIGTSCVNLRELHFMTNSPINQHGLLSLLAGCHNLEALSLSSCHMLHDDSLIAITKSPCAANLKYLCVSQYQNASDSGLALLGEGCPNLKVFLIHYGLSITNSGIRALAEACQNIEWIKIIGCRNVTLGVLDEQGFENHMDCPIVYHPEWPVGLGFAYKKMNRVV